MSISFKLPSYVSAQFDRTSSVSKADNLEKFGNFACGFLKLAFGKSVKVTKLAGSNTLEFSIQKRSLLVRISTAVLYILTLPISLPLFIAGAVSLKYSKSHASLFQQMKKSYLNQHSKKIEENTNKIAECKTGKEAIEYIKTNKLTTANLIEFRDVTNEDLKDLATACPELKKLRVQCKKITEIPQEFKNLEFLECKYGGGNPIHLPEDVSKLKTLIFNCISPDSWPESLKNLTTLHLLETPLNKLPPHLDKLRELNTHNSPWIGKSELEKLPAKCKKVA